MEVTNEVVILSAFGRGQWMAAELARHGHKVALIDVSESLGKWTPEDWEGPFGFFRTERLSATQIERLFEDDLPQPSEQGFTIWLKDGPLELKGPLTKHRLEALGVDPMVRDYLAEFNELNALKNKERNSELSKLPYAKMWLASLAHQISSNKYRSNREGINQGRPLPLFSSHFMRQATRPGYQRSLSWVEQHGAKVIPDAKILDVGFEAPAQLNAIEVSSPYHAGIVKGKTFVWMLSSQETLSISSDLYDKLFEGPANEPQWFWLRFRIQINESLRQASLPNHFIFIETLEFPWTHENLAILQRTYRKEAFDVWMRIPYLHRFQKSYLEKLIEGFKELLSKRLIEPEISIQEYPLEYHTAPDQLGAPRFPVYDSAMKLKPTKAKNLIADGPEAWGGIDWLSQMQVHGKIALQLERRRQEQLRKEAEN